MATPTRHYVVAHKDGSKPARLISTTHPALARSHVAADLLTVRLATVQDAIDMAAAGIKPEKTAPEPASISGLVNVDPPIQPAKADGQEPQA